MAGPPGFEPGRRESESLMLPLHYGPVAGLPGFEPELTESKSVVLPLHHKPTNCGAG